MTKKIGMLGLTFSSGNKGCEALAYSFLEVLNKIGEKKNCEINAVLIRKFPIRKLIRSILEMRRLKSYFLPSIGFNYVNLSITYFMKFRKRTLFFNGIKSCDCVFDFTSGDSFTDIYGQDRFWERTSLKRALLDKDIKLILGSQTIGPFNSKECEAFAADVIKDAHEVYVRDVKSYDYTVKIADRKPKMTLDAAFILPFKKTQVNSKKVKVGFNVSGLLWSCGYTLDNRFNLTVDYRLYCRRVIELLLLSGEYEIHLVMHAYLVGNLKFADNDWIAMLELKEEFKELIVAPNFKTPMDAKSYISEMDVFIGARMHATIAAYSAGIPVIPFSYSRKFEGLYESLNYPYIVHGCGDDTEEAITKTLDWIYDRNELIKEISDMRTYIDNQITLFISEYENEIYE